MKEVIKNSHKTNKKHTSQPTISDAFVENIEDIDSRNEAPQ